MAESLFLSSLMWVFVIEARFDWKAGVRPLDRFWWSDEIH